MASLLIGLIGFILRNFVLLVVIGVLLSVVHNILTQTKKEAIMDKLPSLVLLIGFIAHLFLYWNLAEDRDLLVMIAQCVLPAFVAWMAGGAMYQMGGNVRRQLITLAIAYGVSYLLSVIFSGFLVSLLTLILGLALAALVFTNLGNQYLMDLHSSDRFGDSEEVKRLYREGYRPTGYHDSTKKGSEVRDNLRRHGVNPDE